VLERAARVAVIGVGLMNGIGIISDRRRYRAVKKNADLLVMKGDPAIRIADIENVEIVFKDGVGYDTNQLLDLVKGRYGEY
jgi:hypothetical protein